MKWARLLKHVFDIDLDHCPNCGGEFVRRPRRQAAKLAANPPSTKRIVKAGGRAKAA